MSDQKPKQDFKHIVRIVNTDLDGNKPIRHALTKIKGVGPVFANSVCQIAKLRKTAKTGKLSNDEINRLNEIIKDPAKFGFPSWMFNRRKDYESGQDRHVLTSDLDFLKNIDLRRLKKTKSFRGLRHQAGLPVRVRGHAQISGSKKVKSWVSRGKAAGNKNGRSKETKKKYDTPSHPWEKERIETEKKLMKEYGLVNKKEIWKFNSLLSRFKGQAKKCATASTEQLQKEKTQLLQRLQRLGLLSAKGDLDIVLGLNVEVLLKRRLQSIVFEKKLTSTVKQARQYIVHGHVTVNNKKVTIPSYIVNKDEEDKISIVESMQKEKVVKNG